MIGLILSLLTLFGALGLAFLALQAAMPRRVPVPVRRAVTRAEEPGTLDPR